MAKVAARDLEKEALCRGRLHNAHRPHQGLDNRTLPEAATGPPEDLAAEAAPELGRVRCQRSLGGLLRHY
ncbi:MAG: hypothetical protein IPM18_17410 [Phycisphaerales bacterium]|nr:hypothetical protein [Phycisphaerales bacterium]